MDESTLTQKDMQLAISLSHAPSKYDKYIVLLYKDYGLSLSKANFADVIHKSEQTIDRRIKEAKNIPSYLKSSDGTKASYIFPVVEVAEYLCNTIKVA